MEILSKEISFGGKKMDNIFEQRNKLKDGKYNLSLEVSDSAYFDIYDNADTAAAEDLLRNYLKSNSDDARFENVHINYNRNRHLVNITAELNYYGNVHTNYQQRAKLQNINDEIHPDTNGDTH